MFSVKPKFELLDAATDCAAEAGIILAAKYQNTTHNADVLLWEALKNHKLLDVSGYLTTYINEFGIDAYRARTKKITDAVASVALKASA